MSRLGTSQNIPAIEEAELKLELMSRRLVDVSRRAEIGEVATNVLHNVANVINSINVTASLVEERVRKSRATDLKKLVKLLDEHSTDLEIFLSSDPQGRKVPEFLGRLAERLGTEQAFVLSEMASLRKSVDHIKEIVATQQNYAKISGVVHSIEVTELVEDALRLNSAVFVRDDVRVVRLYNPVPVISTNKQKVLQILINLIENAKRACIESERTDKQVTVRVSAGPAQVEISVADNGVGILPENLKKLFNYGFTTRKEGHGFGLHSCILAVNELRGTLVARSDGRGQGATFVLGLPVVA